MPVPTAVPTAVPIEPHSRRALMAPPVPWRAPRPPGLRPTQAAPRSLHAGPARGLGVSPLDTRHTPHATRDAGLRDAIYKFVARNRIWLFGAVETCRRATMQDKKHFL